MRVTMFSCFLAAVQFVMVESVPDWTSAPDSICSKSWQCTPVYNCQADCPESEYLISGPNGIDDKFLTASSHYHPSVPNDFTPNWSRLNTVETKPGNGGWSAGANDKNQWIQAQFANLRTVVGVAIQGRYVPYNQAAQYVTEFKVSYSTDCIHFQHVFKFGQEVKFCGNTDRTTIVRQMLPTPVTARCVRLHPTAWNEHISMRCDIIGC